MDLLVVRKNVLKSLLLTGAVFFAASNGNAADPAPACVAKEGEAVVAVTVNNIKFVEGNVRAQVYGANPDDFLAKGKKLVRVDTPTTEDGQTVCVPLPEPGQYALVIMLDRNGNGKADFLSEGFGFSRNPELDMLPPGPPDHDEVVIDAPAGVTEIDVTLKYILSTDENTKKRRKLRRR